MVELAAGNVIVMDTKFIPNFGHILISSHEGPRLLRISSTITDCAVVRVAIRIDACCGRGSLCRHERAQECYLGSAFAWRR